jgi:hypothetical protein
MFPFDPSFYLICEGPKLEVLNCDVINTLTLKAIVSEIFTTTFKQKTYKIGELMPSSQVGSKIFMILFTMKMKNVPFNK